VKPLNINLTGALIENLLGYVETVNRDEFRTVAPHWIRNDTGMVSLLCFLVRVHVEISPCSNFLPSAPYVTANRQFGFKKSSTLIEQGEVTRQGKIRWKMVLRFL
jgi:hypothetical protein